MWRALSKFFHLAKFMSLENRRDYLSWAINHFNQSRALELPALLASMATKAAKQLVSIQELSPATDHCRLTRELQTQASDTAQEIAAVCVELGIPLEDLAYRQSLQITAAEQETWQMQAALLKTLEHLNKHAQGGSVKYEGYLWTPTTSKLLQSLEKDHPELKLPDWNYDQAVDGRRVVGSTVTYFLLQRRRFHLKQAMRDLEGLTTEYAAAEAAVQALSGPEYKGYQTRMIKSKGKVYSRLSAAVREVQVRADQVKTLVPHARLQPEERRIIAEEIGAVQDLTVDAARDGALPWHPGSGEIRADAIPAGKQRRELAYAMRRARCLVERAAEEAELLWEEYQRAVKVLSKWRSDLAARLQQNELDSSAVPSAIDDAAEGRALLLAARLRGINQCASQMEGINNLMTMMLLRARAVRDAVLT